MIIFQNTVSYYLCQDQDKVNPILRHSKAFVGIGG